MSESKYLDIFYELELLRVYQNRGISGTVIDSLYDEIFKKHEADSALFNQSHEFYQSQVVVQQQRVDSVIERIKKELERFDELDSLQTQ